MRISNLRPTYVGHFALILPLFVTLLALGWDSASVQAATNQPDQVHEGTAVREAFGIEYSVPNGPRNLVAEGPGRIWYSATDADGIGFLEVITDTVTSEVRYRTEFYGLAQNSEVYDLVYANNAVWFTLRGMRRLGRIDTITREIKLYTLLTRGAAPTGIDVGDSGELWIGQSNGRISRFDPTTETFTEFLLPDILAAAPYVEDLVYQNNRNIWFTMPNGNRVVVYNPVTDRFFDVPTGEISPTNIDLDAEGRPWVTAYGSSRVGRYTPTTVSTWIWFNTPSYNPETPYIETGPAGVLVFDNAQGIRQVWVTESELGSAGRIEIVNSFQVANRERLALATPPGAPWGIILAPDEHIWIADTSRNVLYEVTEPYIYRLYAASISKD
jgi:streptogramin lyase